MTRHPGQHLDLTPAERAPFAPAVGPITVLPHENPRFAQAVVDGGGVLEPLSDATRAIMWLSYGNGDELADVLDAHPAIEWVQLPWAGVDVFAPMLQRFASRDRLLWTSAKGAFSEPVAEHALTLSLATLRYVPEKSRATSWSSEKIGETLYGASIVVVGAGGIAREIIRLFAPFDPDVTIVRRSSEPLEGAARTVTAAQLGEVLPSADVVILAAASTGETAKLIGARELAAMKPSAVLVNIARGALVDTDALVEALASGSIAGAGIDVTDPEPLPSGHPLFSAPNCVVTSHSADTPLMTAPLLAERIRRNVEAFVSTGEFVGVVDARAGY